MNLPIADFDTLVKVFGKAKTVVEKNGVPRMYIRTLAELEDFVKEVCAFLGRLLLCAENGAGVLS